MPTKQDGAMQELITQVALLTERVTSLTVAVEKSYNDHEGRIRNLENNKGELNAQIGEIKQRVGIFNLAQASFTSIVGVVLFWLKKP
jgi:hypothetical protein